jgi:hypothetical protein
MRNVTQQAGVWRPGCTGLMGGLYTRGSQLPDIASQLNNMQLFSRSVGEFCIMKNAVFWDMAPYWFIIS